MARKSNLFIQKRSNVNGHNYFVDTQTGKRRSNTDYSAQWNGNKGRVKRASFNESVKQYKAFESQKEKGEVIDIRDIVRTVVEADKQQDMYKSHAELRHRADSGEENEHGEKSGQIGNIVTMTRLYYNMKESVQGISENSTIRILTPDRMKYQTVDKLTAMSIVSDYIQNVTAKNDELAKNTPEGKTAPYILPLIPMEYNLETDTFTIDLKNPFGMEGNEGILNEINDMFE